MEKMNIGQKSKRRIEIIDIAKAITIFFVIMGHTTGNLDTPMFRRMLYAFHMPLFFMLAGLSMKPKPIHGIKAWLGFLQKNILALVVPYLIWGLIYAPFSYTTVGYLVYGSWQALVKMDTLTSLWYLPCFFVSRVIVQIIISALDYFKIKNIALGCGICAIPLGIIGFFLPYTESGYIWCVNVAFVAVACIMIGIAVRKGLIIVAQQKTAVLVIVTLVCAAFFLIGTIARGDALDLCVMCKGVYGNIVWFILNSISGSATVLIFSMLLFRMSRESVFTFNTTMITYIGQNTMGIYLLHKPIIQQIIMPILGNLLGSSCPLAITALIATIITLPLSLLLCTIIQKFIPQLLGEFPNEWRHESQTSSF